MDNKGDLPFKVGQLAEARSFQNGFRGAWFRCKIRDISARKRSIGFVPEYYDFPDEEVKWEKLYQVPPYCMGRIREKSRELMLRPRYPLICNKTQIPLGCEVSEVMVVVDTWKVGDLVDWWTTDCYWSGRILDLLDDDKAKIELKPPPFGEGKEYDVCLKDIRPSLDWSREHGWTVPTQDGDNARVCARLIKPNDGGRETESWQGTDERERMELRQQLSGNTTRKDVNYMQESVSNTNSAESCKRKRSADDISETNSVKPTAGEELHSGSPPTPGAAEAVSLNSSRSDTIEAAIIDLEELVNKVKWIKKILEKGVSFSVPERPEWRFVGRPAASSRPK